MQQRAQTVLVLLSICALLASGCGWIVDSSSESPARLSLEAPAERSDRQDCSAILGTAFRSNEERAWYEKECSKWPSAEVSGDLMATNPVPQAGESDRGSSPAVISEPAGPDRLNCDEIRGTSFRSSGEESWYQRNCPTGQPSVPVNEQQTTAQEAGSSSVATGGPVVQPQAANPVRQQAAPQERQPRPVATSAPTVAAPAPTPIQQQTVIQEPGRPPVAVGGPATSIP